MTNPTARAIATVAVSAGCTLIAAAVPSAAFMAVFGIILATYYIWRDV